jgi:DNA topoisomerase-1
LTPSKDAILTAMANPRQIDEPLVDAYLARRALDYLVGFTLSPVLWRKLPGAKSAGRVQSVALRLVCDRESEIEAFKTREYWTVEAGLKTAGGDGASAACRDGKLDKFDIADRSPRTPIATPSGSALPGRASRRRSTAQPAPPFTTSSLQQKHRASWAFPRARPCRSPGAFMKTSTSARDGGLITYMRTDGVQIVPEAIDMPADRDAVWQRYVPPAPRLARPRRRMPKRRTKRSAPISGDSPIS